MTQNDKSKFRRSAKWKKFRIRMKKTRKIDALTLQPLRAGFNLHHCDLREDNYTNISDDTRFECLNKMSHETIHNIYRYWLKDPAFLDRLELILIKMREFSQD